MFILNAHFSHYVHDIVRKRVKHAELCCSNKLGLGLTLYLGQCFLSSVGPNESEPAETFRG